MTETTQTPEVQTGPRNFILSHGQLCLGKERPSNANSFREDFEKGRFRQEDGYQPGEAVAYHKGVWCGHGPDVETLWENASGYYGSSNLAAFPLPEDESELDRAVENGFGYISPHERRSSQARL